MAGGRHGQGMCMVGVYIAVGVGDVLGGMHGLGVHGQGVCVAGGG